MKEIAALRPRMVLAASDSNYDVIAPTDRRPDRAERAAQIRAEGERRTAERLLQSAANVIFIADTPHFPQDPVLCLLAHPRGEDACQWQLTSFLPRCRFPVTAGSLDPRIAVIDFNRDICGGDTCAALSGGSFLMHDRSHISETTAAALSGRFLKLLKEARAADER